MTILSKALLVLLVAASIAPAATSTDSSTAQDGAFDPTRPVETDSVDTPATGEIDTTANAPDSTSSLPAPTSPIGDSMSPAPHPRSEPSPTASRTIDMGTTVIVGTRRPQRLDESSRSISVLGADDLRRKHAQSLSEALRNLPGVELVEQGPGVAKPSIRGMTNQRVVLIRDGIRHEAQQWSNHHTPEVDLSDAERVEVLRGPGSLLYGSGALGGVMFVRSPETKTLSQGASPFGGGVDYAYFTNTNQNAGHACLHGATDLLAWRFDLAGRRAPWYAVPGRSHFLVKQAAGAVNDSTETEFAGFENWNVRAQGGYRDDDLELSLSGTQYWERQTLIGEGHWHNSGGPDGGPWYHVGEPIESPTLHRKIQAHARQRIDDRQELVVDAAFQHDHRRGIPGSVGTQVDLENHLANANALWTLGKTDADRHSAGASFARKWDRSYGVEVLIPDHNTTDGGLYYLHSHALGNALTLSAGARGDWRHYEIIESKMTSGFRPVETVVLRGISLDSIPALVVEGSADAVVPSFSAGLSWKTPAKPLTLGVNFGSGFRLPEPNELAILGAHHGSYEYLVGLAVQDPSSGSVRIRSVEDYRETALNTEMVSRWNSASVQAEFSVFHNRLYDYIYARPTGEFVWLSAISALPVKEYVQGDAAFYGFEFDGRVKATRNLSLHGVANFVIGEILEPVEDADGDGKVEPWLPQVSPPRLSGEAEYALPWNLAASVGADGFLPQERLAEFENVTRRNSDGTNEEFESEGYVLYNAGLRWERVDGGRKLSVSIRGTNLANTKYTSHLSSYKGIASDPGFGLSFKTAMEF